MERAYAAFVNGYERSGQGMATKANDVLLLIDKAFIDCANMYPKTGGTLTLPEWFPIFPHVHSPDPQKRCSRHSALSQQGDPNEQDQEIGSGDSHQLRTRDNWQSPLR